MFATDKTLKVNGAALALRYYGPSHTDGDISVSFMEADILHTGDTYWNGFYPFIDYSTGGSLDGTIRATEANLVAATDRTIVIPSHGPISNKSQIKDYRDMLVAVREKAAGLKKQGRSLDETVAAKLTAAYDAKWGQFAVSPAFSRSWSTWAGQRVRVNGLTERGGPGGIEGPSLRVCAGS